MREKELATVARMRWLGRQYGSDTADDHTIDDGRAADLSHIEILVVKDRTSSLITG